MKVNNNLHLSWIHRKVTKPNVSLPSSSESISLSSLSLKENESQTTSSAESQKAVDVIRNALLERPNRELLFSDVNSLLNKHRIDSKLLWHGHMFDLFKTQPFAEVVRRKTEEVSSLTFCCSP